MNSLDKMREEFERKWIRDMGEHCPLTIANVSVFFSNYDSENMEEIDRLARLCEAKDAEIALAIEQRNSALKEQISVLEKLSEAQAQCKEKDVEIEKLHTALSGQTCFVPPEFQQQLSEAQAQIAMLHNFLYFLRGEFGIISLSAATDIEGIISCADRAYDRITDELSATSETVAAWRAKETEPLRREVVMLLDVVQMYSFDHAQKLRDNTQATALAYELEVAANAKLEFAQWLCTQTCVQTAAMQYIASANKGE